MLNFLRSGQSAPRPSLSDVLQQVSEGKMLLIDVREVAEAKASGIAEGARLIPLSLLPLKCDPRQPGCELPQGVPVAVYCASGGRSGMAADTLARMGYGEVTNLGGLRDLAAGGCKVVAL
ncbi:rhodanese-like domain-containing protein [Tabrizicola sp.]|uniref:rhodanese-like domain-containing protein n=1 Tax=Tabrizicola sp. TaxID=2005166 RepID=UPI0027375259|nr:rhodanese-like domain-containing protein [Tabrizicola sp.]MDP3194515.1 rhodanese-like domain-containing protein [Tabrizicola sp.]